MRETKTFLLRLPLSLKDAVERISKEEGTPSFPGAQGSRRLQSF
jgi:hypothetical protein